MEKKNSLVTNETFFLYLFTLSLPFVYRHYVALAFFSSGKRGFHLSPYANSQHTYFSLIRMGLHGEPASLQDGLHAASRQNASFLASFFSRSVIVGLGLWVGTEGNLIFYLGQPDS